MANFKHAVCTVGSCGMPHKARGMCNPHYQKAKKEHQFFPKPWAAPEDRIDRTPKGIKKREDIWEFIKKELQL